MGISPNDFASVFGELVAARTKERSASGFRRAVLARMEKAGTNMRALRLLMQLRDMEAADAEALLVETLRMARWLDLPFGAQAKLFGAEVEKPSQEAQGTVAGATAFEEGYTAGRAGRPAETNRFMQGSPLHQQWWNGWIDGQAAIAAEMGVDRPEDGSAIQPPKSGRKPKAKDAGTDSESSAGDPLEKARRHLN